MSSFLKRGQREAVKAGKREVKKRIKEVYKIMEEMETLAQYLVANYEEEELTEDKIESIAQEHTERQIGDFERFLLAGKVYSYYENKRHTESEERE